MTASASTVTCLLPLSPHRRRCRRRLAWETRVRSLSTNLPINRLGSISLLNQATLLLPAPLTPPVSLNPNPALKSMSHPRLLEIQEPSSQSPPPYSPLGHEVERDFNFLVYALGVGPSQPRAQCLHRRRTKVHFLTHEVATSHSRISEDGQQLVQDQVPGSRIPSPWKRREKKGLSTLLQDSDIILLQKCYHEWKRKQFSA